MERSNIFKILSFFIPIASLLSFSIQPIIGKYLLPTQGGNVSSWFTIVLFFQSSLLIGYILALFINKLPLVQQYLIFLAISALSLFTFDLTIHTDTTLTPIGIILNLSLKLFFPMTLLFSYSILIQGWLSHENKRVPYYLFALSNFGSLIGLLTYPFLIEGYYGLSIQSRVWSITFYLYLFLVNVLIIILLIRQYRSQNFSMIKQSYKPELKKDMIPKYILWILLNLVPCILFLDFTRILTIERGSHPFTWVLPLAFYLLAMSTSFSGDMRLNSLNIYLLCLLSGIFILVFNNIFTLQQLHKVSMGGYALLLFGGISGGLRLLYYYRPYKEPKHFNSFYICIAIGGVFSGILVNFVFPYLFIRPIEGIFSAFIIMLVWVLAYFNSYEDKFYLISKKSGLSLMIISLVLIGVSAYYYFTEKNDFPHRKYYRSIYSTYRLEKDKDNDIYTFYSGYTMHGIQVPGKPLHTTAYYHEQSPLGLWIRHYQEKNVSYDICMIGLGIGVVSAYNRESDSIKYFEIDPLVKNIAINDAYFLNNSKGKSEIIIEDGRIGVKRSDKFDFIIIDAFTGMGIPQHLLTREAIKTYMDKSREGLVIMHISNRYWDLSPLIRGLCESLNYDYRIIKSRGMDSRLYSSSTYAFIFNRDISSFLDIIENNYNNNFHHTEESLIWTDDLSSILSLPRL